MIWPDADEPGEKYAGDVARIVSGLGCEVSIVDAVALASLTPDGNQREPEKGWDAANALTEWQDIGALRKAAHGLAKPFDAKAQGTFVSFVSPPNEHSHESEWPIPKPIESSLPAVDLFVPELLPNAIRDYVLDVADRQQAQADFAAVAALCGLASLAGNKVRIRPKQHDDWEVVPNLWGAIIGRPSAMKSPAMRSALAPVYAIQDSIKKDWEAAQCDASIEAALFGSMRKR